jgi:hypothetical protein
MVKIEEIIKTKSYWRNDCEHERQREQEKKVKIFGVTLWHIKYDYDCSLDDEKINGVGFKK